MAAFGRVVQEGPQEVRVRHLEALKQLLHVENVREEFAFLPFLKLVFVFKLKKSSSFFVLQ